MSSEQSTEKQQQQGDQLENGPVPLPIDTQMALLAGAIGGNSALEVHNFDGTPRQQWELSSLAVGGEGDALSDNVDEIIEVKYAYIHGVQVAGQAKGEVVDALRVVLITPDLQTYHCVSGIVAADVQRMWAAFGRKPFVPAVKVKVAKRKTGSGRTIFTLIPVKE